MIHDGPIAYLEGSQSSVFFSSTPKTAGSFQPSGTHGTAPNIRKMQNAIDVAYYGEDNRFPQNIAAQMAYCGIGLSALDWKARALYGGGIVPGTITGYDDDGEEIFAPLNRIKYKEVYDFIENRAFLRWFLEYSIDWVWYGNCFTEAIFSKDASVITGLIHQETCDCRFKQMDDAGNLDTVFISKLWGASKDQYAHFDPKKSIPGLLENPIYFYEVDNKFIKPLACMDMYDSLNSLISIAAWEAGRPLDAYKSCIIPSNYPSVNKTYYQVPAWDGARLGGWVEIASKVPNMLKKMYEQAFTIKFHIELSESYFEKKYSFEMWHAKSPDEKTISRTEVLKSMDKFLSGEENAYKSFISVYDVDPITKKEYGNVKITPIENKTTIDKDLLISNSAGLQILIAMQVHPALFSAGMTGGGGQGAGSGSDIREAFLVYNAMLNLERQVMLEPLYHVRDFNRENGKQVIWESDIQFRIKDTVLTTLDTGAGTAKIVS